MLLNFTIRSAQEMAFYNDEVIYLLDSDVNYNC